MESLCEYFMYFPAVPVSNLSDPAQFARLPQRKHVYLGEVDVQLLLVLRFRDNGGGGEGSGGGGDSWNELLGSLTAVASVSVAESRQRRVVESPVELQSGSGTEDEETRGEEGGGGSGSPTFTLCEPLLIHNSSASMGRRSGTGPVKSVLVSKEQVVFCLSVSLDKLPVSTLKAKVVVTVWTQEQENVEESEHGYLTLLQLRSPTHTFRKDTRTFKAQVNTTLNVVPPPRVHCQQITLSGKHLTLLKVVNCSSQEDVCVRDVRILPDYNSSYLPMMPDGSVLIVDNVCHQSAEVAMASFCRMDGGSSRLPSTLSALEEHNFLFQLQLQDKGEENSSEGLEIPLVAVVQWFTPAHPLTRSISSCYSVPSIRLDRPQLVMTASCPSAVRPLENFWVRYTLLNNLQDFMAVRLMWNSEAQQNDSRLSAVVCRSPVNNLGQCRKGSVLSFSAAFQVLRTGLFELSQHMKLKLQFTTSVSSPPLPHPHPPSPQFSRDVMDGQSHSRSRSFSHQQTTRPHHVRSGSVMEGGARTPVGGRVLCPPPDHALIALDKIAKRECKILVLESTQDLHCR